MLTVRRGDMTTIFDDAAQAREAGVSEADIAAALAGRRREAIKAMCARRIYAVASPAAQQNMAAAATLVSAKQPAERDEEETAMLAAFAAALAWVRAMRAAVGALAADPEADFEPDAAWPACPPEVAALAASF